MTGISSTSILQQLLQKNDTTSNGSKQAAQPTLTDYLARAQGLNTTGETSASGNSYLLDLSPAAQAYLTNMSGTGSATSQNSATSSNGNGIVLSPGQQNKLTAILVKYKDAPYNDDTFKAIQRDMSEAGIGADSLAAKNQMRRINATAMLLDALNGGDGSVGTVGGSADLAHSEMEFMGRVNTQWQKISSDYNPATDGSKSELAEDDSTAGGTSGADA